MSSAPFRSVGHAVRRWQQLSLKHAAAKTSLGVAVHRLELGTQIQGGVGSVVEDELLLLAAVEACLPRPAGPQPDPCRPVGELWARWYVFVLAYRDGRDVADIARTLRQAQDDGQLTLAESLSWHRVRRWLVAATREFRDALERRGLLA